MTSPSSAELEEEHVPLTSVQKGQGDGDSPKAGSSSNRVTEGDEEVAVCRICLEEDTCSNLEAPCSCSGTMKHAHHSCLQRWCNEKGDLTCEICKQPFRGDFEEPPPPPPRSQHVTVWGQEYLIVADPETGTIRAHRLQASAELFDEEDAEEEATRLQTGTAWWFTAILLALCLLLVRHLFSLVSSAGVPSGGAGTGHAPGEGAGGGGGAGAGGQGQAAPHHHGDEADSAFEDLSMTLLILWLLVRMLVMIAPFYTVWGGAAAWARGRAANWHSEQRQRAQRGDTDAQSDPDAVAEIELEQRLDRIIQRMEAGGAVDENENNRESGRAEQEGTLGERHEGQRQESQQEEQQQQQPQQQHTDMSRT
ncbi:hypothetical protein N2152v2_004753 [Parachlorella kessleri]